MSAKGVPAVSIVTATYNRSNVLEWAIRSVLASDFHDWEMVIVGDACTDDTAEKVASFGDARLQFVNLERNVGEQSGPNNEGFRRARGRFVALLNHDDLWFPDHLSAALSRIEETRADLVYSLTALLRPGQRPVLLGATHTGFYEPYAVVPASSWLLRRELIDEVGGWRRYRQIYNHPSGDWIDRAARAGKSMRGTPRLTVVSFASGYRPGCYAEREAHEQQMHFESMQGVAGYREHLLTDAVAAYAAREADLRVSAHLGRAVKNAVRRTCVWLGVHPASFYLFLRHRRKGGGIDHLRRIRGLGEVAAP